MYGTAHYHWLFGFIFGAAIGALAAVVVGFLCTRPTVEQMEAAVRGPAKEVEAPAKPAVA